MKNSLDNKIFYLLSIIKSKYSCITLKKDKEYIDYNLKRFPIFAHGKYGRNKKPIEKYIEEVKILIKIYDSIEFLEHECIPFNLHLKIDDCYIKMTNFMNQHLERIYVMQLHKKELTDNIQLKPEYRELQIKTYISFYLEKKEEEERDERIKDKRDERIEEDGEKMQIGRIGISLSSLINLGEE